MQALSASELFRKNHTTILKAIAETGQARIAEQLGVSESTVSRLKDGDLERLAGVLAAAGLKVVLATTPTVDPDHLTALTILAREALEDTGWGKLR